MHAWEQWKKTFAERLGDVLVRSISPEEILVPQNPEHGDFAFGCFKLAKERGQSPAAIAQDLAAHLRLDHTDFAEVAAVGPYVNVRLETRDAVHRVVRDIETAEDAYVQGVSKPGKIVLEYANPNTHKELHVGHLRNIVLGVALVRTMQAAGYPVVPIGFLNDVGSNVGKTLWYLVQSEGEDVRTFDETALERVLHKILPERRTGNELGRLYTEATRAVEADETRKEDVSFVQQQLEAHTPAWEQLWRETRRWCIDEMAQIFADLGVTVERQYFESDLLDRSHEVVRDLLAKGIAKESEGAVIVDLEEEKLGVVVLRKQDGTLLYSAKDLALAEWKRAEYPDMTASWVLVDMRQSLYFRQLGSILKKLGIVSPVEAIVYELVTLPEGAMSSRKGNIVTFQQLRDTVLAYAREEVVKRHPEWHEGKVAHTAWAIAIAGMKFGMVKQDPDKVFTFDLAQQLAFDGATGPYIQYAATRMGSILRKAESQGVRVTDGELSRAATHPTEKALALQLAKLPSVVAQSGAERKPALVAHWALETAQAANAFYRDVPVLEGEIGSQVARLRLCRATRRALEKALFLLGIPLPDEM